MSGHIVEITVQLRAEVDVPAQLLGLHVDRLFADSVGPGMRSWLRLLVPDDRNVDEVVRELGQLADVEAAYV